MLPLTPDVAARDRRAELMDEPGLERRRHVAALRALERVNRVSGTAARLWKLVAPLCGGPEPLRLLDLACGGGDVVIDLGRRARRAGVALELAGCDASAVAVEYARSRAEEAGIAARFLVADVVGFGLPAGYDVICSSLFLHHLERAEAVDLLSRMAAAARRRTVVQDLRRTRLGYVLAWIGVRLLSRSDVAHTDGPLSVRSAFSLEEVEAIAGAAGLDNARVERCWPQRFLLCWDAP